MPATLYRDFTTVEELDAQYDIEASVPDFGMYVEQFIARSAVARLAGLDGRRDRTDRSGRMAP